MLSNTEFHSPSKIPVLVKSLMFSHIVIPLINRMAPQTDQMAFMKKSLSISIDEKEAML